MQPVRRILWSVHLNGTQIGTVRGPNANLALSAAYCKFPAHANADLVVAPVPAAQAARLMLASLVTSGALVGAGIGMIVLALSLFATAVITVAAFIGAILSLFEVQSIYTRLFPAWTTMTYLGVLGGACVVAAALEYTAKKCARAGR